MKSQMELTVYYDGLCEVCSKEIRHYQKQSGADQIDFVDICLSSFNADREGLNPNLVHKVMHVRRKDGSIVTRVGAFIEIWKVLPKYRFLSQIAMNPIVKAALELGYSCFATVRPLLPRSKSKSECQDSPYCEVKKKSEPL